jgi:hypothetical protein
VQGQGLRSSFDHPYTHPTMVRLSELREGNRSEQNPAVVSLPLAPVAGSPAGTRTAQNRIIERARNHPSNFHRTAAQMTGRWLEHDDHKCKTKELEHVKRAIVTMEPRMRQRAAQSFFARSAIGHLVRRVRFADMAGRTLEDLQFLPPLGCRRCPHVTHRLIAIEAIWADGGIGIHSPACAFQ